MSSSSADARAFAQQQLFEPILTKALAGLCHAKPENPVEWLAEYLLHNNPNKPEALDNVVTGTVSGTATGKARWLPAPGEETQVVAERSGNALSKGAILKADNAAANRVSHLQTVSGAPNFWRAEGFPVFCSGQPTAEGAANALDSANASLGSSSAQALVLMLRESLVVYVNGVPFSVRSQEHPFEVIWSTDEMTDDVETAEQALKKEVIAEIARCGGKLLLHDECDPEPGAATGQVFSYWATVKPENVQTPAEAISAALGPRRAQVVRIPIANDHSPTTTDVSLILAAISELPVGAPVLLIDRMGMGRATTAAFIACLYLRAQGFGPASPPPLPPSVYPKGTEALKRGIFASVHAILRQFGDAGGASLANCEDIAQRVGQTVDVRGATYNAMVQLSKATHEGGIASAKARRQALWVLDRWTSLLLTAQYLNEIPNLSRTLASWTEQYHSLTSAIEELGLQADPKEV